MVFCFFSLMVDLGSYPNIPFITSPPVVLRIVSVIISLGAMESSNLTTDDAFVFAMFRTKLVKD